jgi:hypothetical protein
MRFAPRFAGEGGNTMRDQNVAWLGAALLVLLAAPSWAAPRDPDKAEVQPVDRFSDAAGMLFRRSADPSLPMPSQPINMDSGPFITYGLGPRGERVAYYNFDVQSTTPALIHVLLGADGKPVPGQLNLVDAVPGEAGYNDFWRVMMVQTPAGYQANDITSVAALNERLQDPNSGFRATLTEVLVNCPIVPAGSRARFRLGGGPSSLNRGWFRDRIIHYFSFEEGLPAAGGRVPVSSIWVMFANNMDPSDGFVTEPTGATRNVLATLPGEGGYSPLWSVSVMDNRGFNDVRDIATAAKVAVVARDVATVNCPVVRMSAAAN